MPRNQIFGYRAQTRSKMILYTLAIGLLLLVCASFQVSFLSRFRFFGATPDLMLCVVLCVAYFSGRFSGAITGIAAGFLIEAIGSQGISFLPMFYMLCGYIVGYYTRTVTVKNYSVYLFYLGFGLCLRAAMTVTYACVTYAYIRLPEILWYAVLPEVGGTALIGCLLYFPMKLFCRRLER